MKNVASEAKNYHWHEYLIKGNNLLLKFFFMELELAMSRRQ